jgi:two-component system, NarL family, response regulator LiaR
MVAGPQSGNRIRVLLVDDHAVVRSGLSAFMMIFDDLEFVGAAENGQQAIRACAELHPDVVLMDLVMPVMDGAAATREICNTWPAIQVLALTSYKEDDLVQRAINAGAIGYLLKNLTADELAMAIRAAFRGKPTLSAEAAQALMRVNRQHYKTHRYDLTIREKEVLALMIRGLNNIEIANRLVVSRSTVKFHVSSLLSKLGASSRTEAVAIAIQNQLVDQ